MSYLVDTNVLLLILENVHEGEQGDHYTTFNSKEVPNNGPQLVISTIPSCISPPPGLVSWWTGDGDANDISGGNHGTRRLGGFDLGVVEQAFRYNGANDLDAVEIQANESTDVGMGDGFTIETWVKHWDTIRALIAEWSDPGRDYPGAGVWLYGTGGTPQRSGAQLKAEIYPVVGSRVDLFSETKLQPHIWHHVALIYDKSTGTIKLYHNGQIVAQHTQAPFTPRTSYNLNLGYHYPAYNYPLKGLLDEVSLYNRALSGESTSIL